ncbi:hypothetical protein CC2G_013399 [Coprinopsis cinerea AmutBmut pab1-1]|nr:hypothetical protein CC2G_013399 [Coprinopsis cinerea AmutBmut pab1-1]
MGDNPSASLRDFPTSVDGGNGTGSEHRVNTSAASTDLLETLHAHITEKRFVNFLSLFHNHAAPLIEKHNDHSGVQGNGVRRPSQSPEAAAVGCLHGTSVQLTHLRPNPPIARAGPFPPSSMEVSSLLEKGFEIVPYTSSTRLFLDGQGIVQFVLVPCPEALLQANINEAFHGDMKAIESSLDFTAIAQTAVATSRFHDESKTVLVGHVAKSYCNHQTYR